LSLRTAMPTTHQSKHVGNCYEVHAKALLLGEQKGLLCHGEVFNPRTGRFHGHCWLEQPLPLAIDVVVCRDLTDGRDMVVPKGLYYSRGRVRRVKRYTEAQARAKLAESEVWGPWKPRGASPSNAGG
jgi:hypothetical protein